MSVEEKKGGEPVVTDGTGQSAANLTTGQYNPQFPIRPQELSLLAYIPQVSATVLSKVEEEAWVQCERPDCLKWRRISKAEANRLGDQDSWFCHMNTDKLHDACHRPEEDYRTADRLVKKCQMKYTFSSMEEGTLVWAKMTGYCRWPAVITPDPTDGQSRRRDPDGDTLSYHVEYLGPKHSHNWVHNRFVELFGAREDDSGLSEQAHNSGLKSKRCLPGLNKGLRYQYHGAKVKDAVRQADDWLKLSPTERLELCSFKFDPSKPIIPGHSGGGDATNSTHKESKKRRSSDQHQSHKKAKLSAIPDTTRKPGPSSLTKSTKTHNVINRGQVSKSKKVKMDTAARPPQAKLKQNTRPFVPKFTAKSKSSSRPPNAAPGADQVPGGSRPPRDPGSEGEDEWAAAAHAWTAFEFDDEVQLDHINNDQDNDGGDGDKAEPGPEVQTNQPTGDGPDTTADKQDTHHSLLNRSKEEKFTMDIETYVANQESFDGDVRSFLKTHGVTLRKMPVWQNVPVTLYQIHLAVDDRGGYTTVSSKKQWRAVYRELTGDPTQPNGSSAKAFYERYLLPYDLYRNKQDYRHLLVKKPRRESKTPKAERRNSGTKNKSDDKEAKEPEKQEDSGSSVCSEELREIMDDLQECTKDLGQEDLVDPLLAKELKLAFYDENSPDLNFSPKCKVVNTEEFAEKPKEKLKKETPKKPKEPKQKDKARKPRKKKERTPKDTPDQPTTDTTPTGEAVIKPDSAPRGSPAPHPEALTQSPDSAAATADLLAMSRELDELQLPPSEDIKQLSDKLSHGTTDIITRLSQLRDQAMSQTARVASQSSEPVQRVPHSPATAQNDPVMAQPASKTPAVKPAGLSKRSRPKGFAPPRRQMETQITLEPLDPVTFAPLADRQVMPRSVSATVQSDVLAAGTDAGSPPSAGSGHSAGSDSDPMSQSDGGDTQRAVKELTELQQMEDFTFDD